MHKAIPTTIAKPERHLTMSDYGFRPDLKTFRDDPYPVYHSLHQQGPIIYREASNDWLVVGYDAVKTLLKQRPFQTQISSSCPFSAMTSSPQKKEIISFVTQGGDWLRLYNFLESKNILIAPKKEHSQIRAIYHKSLNHFYNEQLPDKIREFCQEILSHLSARSEIDIVAEYAHPLTLKVFSIMLGVPEDEAQTITNLARQYLSGKDLTASKNDSLQGKMSYIKLTEKLSTNIDERTIDGNSALGKIIEAFDDGLMDYVTLLAQALSLATGGFENTRNTIVLAIYHLITQQHNENSNPLSDVNLPLATEECIRFDSPVQCLYFTISNDTILEGQELKKGQRCYLILGAANRDPVRFSSPDKFLINRKALPSLSFGAGDHYCLGASLTRLEVHEAISALLKSLPKLTISSEPTLNNGYVFRGLDKLAVNIG